MKEISDKEPNGDVVIIHLNIRQLKKGVGAEM
jgi:hypothetical protein